MGKVQHLTLYMIFSFWGSKGVGEREFSLFLMCSHHVPTIISFLFHLCLGMVQLPFAQVVEQGVREAKGNMTKQCF